MYIYVYFKTYAWWKGPPTPPSLSCSLVSCESCRVSLVRMVSHAMSLLTLDRCPIYHPTTLDTLTVRGCSLGHQYRP